MIVDSSATTGSPSSSARATFSETTTLRAADLTDAPYRDHVGMDPSGPRSTEGRPPSICTIGDLILDVVVLPDAPLAPDGDTPATIRLGAGGQAANVAAWAAALGATSRLICKRGTDAASELAAAELARHGVEICGPVVEGRGGVVVSVRDAGGRRTMASDRGVASLLHPSELDPSWVQLVRRPARLGLLPAPRADGAGGDRGREARAPRDRRSGLRARHRDRRRPAVRRAPGGAASRSRVRDRGRAGRGARLRRHLGDQARRRGARASPRACTRPARSSRSTPPAPATRWRPDTSSAGPSSRSRPRRGALALIGAMPYVGADRARPGAPADSQPPD